MLVLQLKCTAGESKLNLLGAQYWKCSPPDEEQQSSFKTHQDIQILYTGLQRAVSAVGYKRPDWEQALMANCLVSWASMEARMKKTPAISRPCSIPSTSSKMLQLIPSTTPIRTFEDHEDATLRLWDLETGVVLKKMEGYSNWVRALAVSRNGQIIASSDLGGEVIAWHGETGESITQPIKAHPYQITSVDFSRDGMVLATGSWDKTVKFWSTKTPVHCVRYSPSGELLAIATYDNIQVYNPGTRERVAFLTGWNVSLAWTPDGTRLLSGGSKYISEWDTSTWQQVGHRWEGHTKDINAIVIHPSGTLVASASDDNHVRLWRLSDQRTIAVFQHSSSATCATFCVDGKHILGGGEFPFSDSHYAIRASFVQILDITIAARDACLTGDLSIAEELLTQDVHTNVDDFISYANRSFVRARKHDWDHALDDAIQSINFRPSLVGFISKGIALCGKGHVREARIAFDVASMFTSQNSQINQFLLLIKINMRKQCCSSKTWLSLVPMSILARRVVETYLRVQLGIKAIDGARHDEAADHFTAAVNSDALSSKYIHFAYQDLTMLFGWDLESLLLTTHQKRCQAFLSAGKLDEALQAHKYMMDAIDDIVKASCLDWSNGKSSEKCSTLAADNDRILGAEIPGQEQDGYDAGPNFFYGTHQHSQISRPRVQQRPGRLKRFRLAMARRPQEAPAPTPAPPTTSPPVTVTTTIKTHLRHLFSRSPHHVTPPVVEVPFAQGRQRNAAAGAPGSEHSLIRDEDALSPDPNTQQHRQQQQQQQQQAVAIPIDPGQHGGGKSCVCC
ncbi:WD40-repeat-containing domain protein [Suillus fuscotomentosus]|uniref:WD40-repeat-containing domain protein n=1 Tax=Suillus fuscotomentosus TaxID=1912939 RepID=A0AAD4DP69_9AGAM|nr:WD40-repeat-containing domain protein [Suillus fuscotomentosus]KAG1887519.1 WD40-repeat-containing domain protein [Suillus fuscotomentosus]